MKQQLLTVVGTIWTVGYVAMSVLSSSLLASARPHPTMAAQTASPEFEVASVKRNNSRAAGVEGSGRIRIQTAPGTLSMQNVTLVSCVRWAYDVHDYQISGPSGFGSARYDIIAKAASPVGDDQLKLMLRTLLANRFKLSLHPDRRELPVFGLTVVKNGPRLKPADPTGEPGTVPAPGGITYKKMSMADLATALSNMPPIGRPVIDKTGVPGAFDVTLSFVDASAGREAADLKRTARDEGPTMFMDALERVGLRLQPERAAVDFIVIDRMELPTED